MKRIVRLFLFAVLFMSAVGCNNSRQTDQNPLLSIQEWNTPFGVPPFDKIKAEHYMPAFEQAMSRHNAEIDAIVNNNDTPTFENVIEAYDAAGQELYQVELIFGMVSAAEMTPELEALQPEVMPLITAHYDKIGLNEQLFSKIKAVYDNRSTMKLRADQERLLEKIYSRFVRSGALLSAADKEQLSKINEQLSSLSVKFGQNLLNENKRYKLLLSTTEELEGLPNGVKDAAKAAATDAGYKDKWMFTLSPSSMVPFLSYSSRRDLREQIYTAYIERGNHNDSLDQKGVIRQIVDLRSKRAKLLGFKNHASYVIADQMAKSPEAAYGLLNEVWEPALNRAKDEQEQMDKLFQKDHPGSKFEKWDWWYYAEKLRKQNYSLDEEMLRPYFSLENAQSGIFFLANRLYGITFRPVNLPQYHSECSAVEVLDTDGSHLGILYFDFHPRAGKSGGAWCGYYREQSYKDGQRVAPVVSIVCNFTRPTGSTPALLTIDEVETLFHEFGHALHFLFHDVKYRTLESVEGDFVELPSQIMENWAFEPEMLAHYATHYATGEVIPENLQRKMRNSSLFNQGFATTELAAAALIDLDIHTLESVEADFDVMAFEKRMISEKRGLIPQISPRYRYPYFSHIFDGGYAAGYYFYLWAECLDKDAYDYFRGSRDLFNRDIAEKFRREVLARGGEADGMTLYRNFRGEEPSRVPMLKGRGLWTEPEVVDSLADDSATAKPEPLKHPMLNRK